MDEKTHVASARPEKLPAPAWFNRAIAVKPTSHHTMVEGCDIHFLRWGPQSSSQPGILFVHGGGAHAHWWSFIAPFFAADRPVAAIDLSGMGDSGRRPEYTARLRAEEIAAVLDAAVLGEKPVVVGHSFGGFMTMCFGRHYGERISAAVIVDSPVRPPDVDAEHPRREFGRRKVSYPDFETIVARFRLMPAQDCENDFIVDYIGRHSVMQIDDGWTWKFDLPALGARRFDEPFGEHLQLMPCRKALIYGAESALLTPEVARHMMHLMGPETPVICMPEAHHHVMLDQPLAFVAALRTLLAGWQAADAVVSQIK